jgi:hypothetical protein
MKKIIALFVCIGLILSVAVTVFAQKGPVHKSPSDSVGLKVKAPRKQIHRQNEQTIKAGKKEIQLLKPEIWKDDRPLLMKEKDTLRNKSK